MFPPPLYVVTAVFNPRRYQRRYELYRSFSKHMTDSGAKLFTVELALGQRPFEVTAAGDPMALQLRSDDEWFVKENLLNLAFRRLPADAHYVAWVDADVQFVRKDWAAETVHMLQHHPVVQMFSQVMNLNPDDEPFQRWRSFADSYQSGEDYAPVGTTYYNFWHPGFAWATTLEALARLGGLLERIILGSADSHMAASLIGRARQTIHKEASRPFKDYVFDWENNAQKWFKETGKTLGVVKGSILHYWHGRLRDRRYKERWEILVEHEFDPYTDVRPDLTGLLRLTDRNPKLRADLQKYLAARDEDSTYFDRSETTLR